MNKNIKDAKTLLKTPIKIEENISIKRKKII